MSHKPRLPMKSTGAAEVLAAGEEIDERNVLCFCLQFRVGIVILCIPFVDSKDLHTFFL